MQHDDRHSLKLPTSPLRGTAGPAWLLAVWWAATALTAQAQPQTAAPSGPPAIAAPQATAAAATAATARPPARPDALEQRLALLTRELSLTDAQRQQVRAILEEQRAHVRELWSDPSLPAAERVGRLKAVTDHTGDAIRAILTPEQRTHYTAPRPPPSPEEGQHALTVWMDRLQGR